MKTTTRTIQTPEEEMLVRYGWQPSGFQLWIHPFNERVQNTKYFTTEAAVKEVDENLPKYAEFKSYDALLLENAQLRSEVERLRWQTSGQYIKTASMDYVEYCKQYEGDFKND